MKNIKNTQFIIGLCSIVILNIVAYLWDKTVIPYTGMTLITIGLQFLIVSEIQSDSINMDKIHKLGAILNAVLFLAACVSILYSMIECAYFATIAMCIFAIAHLFLFVLSYKMISKDEVH